MTVDRVIFACAGASVRGAAPGWLSCVGTKTPACLRCSSDSLTLCVRVPAPTLPRLPGLPSRLEDSPVSGVVSFRRSSAHWRSSILNAVVRLIFGGRTRGSLGEISENASDAQSLAVEGLSIGFGFHGFQVFVCQVC